MSRPGNQVGTTHVTEARLAALQDDLAAASSAAERIAVLAAEAAWRSSCSVTV
jgi:uncharacterized protein YbaP (TraB family)